ncbi:hypothetical protein Scep_030630 [Stephania cephalantha]|uniref:Uncharacterized protein n=1 Tax=Stephania cephalantha TaxID=152367 RepID=A0AAP0E7M9_9MAGN
MLPSMTFAREEKKGKNQLQLLNPRSTLGASTNKQTEPPYFAFFTRTEVWNSASSLMMMESHRSLKALQAHHQQPPPTTSTSKDGDQDLPILPKVEAELHPCQHTPSCSTLHNFDG